MAGGELHSELCLLQWWPTSLSSDSEQSLIHPDDIHTAEALMPHGKVFRKTVIMEDYVVIEYGESKLRVKPEALKSIRNDGLAIGDKVRVLSRGWLKNTVRQGTIVGMMYHHDREQIMYFIHDGHVRLSKRYFSEDLVLSDRPSMNVIRWFKLHRRLEDYPMEEQEAQTIIQTYSKGNWKSLVGQLPRCFRYRTSRLLFTPSLKAAMQEMGFPTYYYHSRD